MFGFFFRKKREDVRTLLSRLMNRRYFRQFRYGDRFDSRGSFCETVLVIPYDEDNLQPVFEQTFPVVTKDISAEGLALIHNEPISTKRMLIGIEGPHGMPFLLCELQHSTPIGYGFYQIGVHPIEVIVVDEVALRELPRRFANAQEVAASSCT